MRSLLLLLAACSAAPGERALKATLTLGTAAHIAVRHAPTACDVSGGRPIIQYWGRPVAGSPIQVQFHRRPLGDAPAIGFLIVSRTRATFHPIEGAPGCQLGVHPDEVMLPVAGSFLTQQGATLFLDVTFPPWMVGSEWFAQALWLDGGNAQGFITGPVIEIVPGVR